MPHVPGLRSPYHRVGQLVYFGRLLDKIRLQAAGKLPVEYHENLGDHRPNQFDARCCRFLGVSYADLAARVHLGGTDAELLAWVEGHGTPRTAEERTIWSHFMSKIGWRDDRSAFLKQRMSESGLSDKPIETFFDLLDFDEGRDPVRSRAWDWKPALVIVLMGVSGSGKTAVGSLLANTLGWPFADADEFHPPANVAKMSSGLPLDDTDRAPWLLAISTYIQTCLRHEESAVVTCSALKQSYRDVILLNPAQVKLVYLRGSSDLLAQRIGGRQGHFMKAQMLKTQLATLETPTNGLTLDVSQTPEQLVAQIQEALDLR